jgi:mRNA interferase MazF
VGLKRGDIVTVALSGDLGKPRPALIIETDKLAPSDHVLVCPGTTFILPESINRRKLVQPDQSNGLRQPTQFQLDKISVTRRAKCGQVIGRLDAATMAEINYLLSVIVGIAE